MNWKLHIARHNTAAYAPAPAGGRLSFTLARPELYNLARDPDESYDVAGENPQIVEEIQRRIKTLLPGFPEQVQKAWMDSQVRKSGPEVPAGAYARPTPQ
jgi:arylsulfatase A